MESLDSGPTLSGVLGGHRTCRGSQRSLCQGSERLHREHPYSIAARLSDEGTGTLGSFRNIPCVSYWASNWAECSINSVRLFLRVYTGLPTMEGNPTNFLA